MVMDSEEAWGDREGGFCGHSLIGFLLLWFGVNGKEFCLGELENSWSVSERGESASRGACGAFRWRCLRWGRSPHLGEHVELSGGGVSEVGEESASGGACGAFRWRCLRGEGGVHVWGSTWSVQVEMSQRWGRSPRLRRAGLEATLGSSLFREGAKGWS